MNILHFGRYIIMSRFISFFRGEGGGGLRLRGIIIFADKWGPRHITEFSKGGGAFRSFLPLDQHKVASFYKIK